MAVPTAAFAGVFAVGVRSPQHAAAVAAACRAPNGAMSVVKHQWRVSRLPDNIVFNASTSNRGGGGGGGGTSDGLPKPYRASGSPDVGTGVAGGSSAAGPSSVTSSAAPAGAPVPDASSNGGGGMPGGVGGNGSASGGGGGGGNCGGGPNGGGADGGPPESAATAAASAAALLAERGVPPGSLPPDLAAAVAAGTVSADTLGRYLHLVRPGGNALLSWATANVASFRNRLLADEAFLFKLAAQEVIGNGTALVGEVAVRGPAIMEELEYVGADVAVGTVVEAAFVWLLAPLTPHARAAAAAAAAGSPLRAALAALPASVCEASSPGRAYTVAQRAASFVVTGGQYAVIGFGAGLVGTALTYGVIQARRALDAAYVPDRPQPAVIPNSAAWAAFMAGSSNVRFQAVDGVELAVDRALGGRRPGVLRVTILGLRTANNLLGGIQFVQFMRWLGLQSTEGEGSG